MSDATPATLLGHPFTLPSGAVVKNRILKSAMSEILGSRDHAPTDGLSRLYGTWAAGGVGLLITGNVMIDRCALGEPANVALEDDRHLDRFKAWARAGTANGTQLWMQLNHPGKQSPRFLSKAPVAPSAVALGAGLESAFNAPRALTEPEIDDIVQRFATSAALAKRAGFSGVQIHGAHGYLVSQFLSPHHNRRTDRWGGSLENRARFVLEVYRAIRAAVGSEFPVGIKLNSADFQKGGFSEDDSAEVVRLLAAEGIDLVEISGGNYETSAMVNGGGAKPSTLAREAFFLRYAERVRAEVDVPLVVTGGFRTSEGMAGAIEGGAVDLVGLARAFAVEPDFPARVLAGERFRSIVTRPTTGMKKVDQLTMLDVTWFENQLARMAAGKAPDPKQGAWSSIARTVWKMGGAAFRMRRPSPKKPSRPAPGPTAQGVSV